MSIPTQIIKILLFVVSAMYRFSLLRLILARDANAFFEGVGSPSLQKRNNLLNRIFIIRERMTL